MIEHLLSRSDAEKLNYFRGNPEMMEEILARISLEVGGETVVAPDESRLPTGAMRQAGFFRLVSPGEFYAAVRAARGEQEASPTPIRVKPARQAGRPSGKPPVTMGGLPLLKRVGKTERDRNRKRLKQTA